MTKDILLKKYIEVVKKKNMTPSRVDLKAVGV